MTTEPTGHFILSGVSQLLIEVEPTEDHDHIVWVATMSGEDFFNGPWKVVSSGVSNDSNEAFREAAEAFTNPYYKLPTNGQKFKADAKQFLKKKLGLT